VPEAGRVCQTRDGERRCEVTRLTDGERELLAEQEADAREIGRGNDPPTDDELDEMAEGYAADVWNDVSWEVLPADDTREPY